MPEIQLPVFRGPLDLLLRLIERDDLDITAVSLVTVTDQYLAAIREDDRFEAQALADFVAIGAKLIYLKSRALLPRPPSDPSDGIEDDEVGMELVDLLVEYRRFAQVTDFLQARLEAGLRVYPRQAPPPAVPEGPGLQGVTVAVMRKIMLDILKRTPPEPRAIVPRERIRLADILARVKDRLRRAGRVSFRRLMEDCRTRVEVVVSFLAVLELLKDGECEAVQSETWGDIEVVAVAGHVAA